MTYKHELVNYQSEYFNLYTSNTISSKSKQQHFPFVSAHWHRSIEIVYVNQGTIEIITNGTKILLEKERYYLINSNHIHSVTFTNEADSEMFILQVPLKTFQFITNDSAVPVFSNDFNHLKYPSIISILKNIFETDAQKNTYSRAKIYSLFFDLIYQLLEHFLSSTEINLNHIDSQERIGLIIKFIEDNATDYLSATEVAEQFEISHEYLSRILKKSTNKNFRDLLKAIRLKIAFNSLMNSSSTITEIALDSGFPNVNSFITAFKEKYSETPAAYRISHKI